MSRIDKSQLKAGQFITLDCPIFVPMQKDAPPKYGQSSEQLDAIKRKIEGGRRQSPQDPYR